MTRRCAFVRRARLLTLLLPLACALLAVAAFSPALGFGWVYDDSWTIVDNRFLERPLGELVGLLASGEALRVKLPDATRPAMVLSLWLDRRLFGLSPLGHHATSLALYGLVAFLAARLALRLSGRFVVAAFAGAFFALAPLHAEPVAAVNYREDLLSAAGVLLALLALVEPGREGRLRLLSASGGFLVALLSKESSLALVPLAGLFVLVVPSLRALLARRRATLFALGVALALWALFRVPLFVHGDDLPVAPARGAVQALLRTARFEVLAVRHAALPFWTSPDPFRQPDAGAFWLVPFSSLVLGVLLLARSPGTRLPALGLGIALAAPLASSPLVGPGNELADRYFFLGVLGGGLFWGFVVERLARRLRLGRARLALPLLCLPMLVPARAAAAVWKDERSLWTFAVKRSPDSARAHAALARVLRFAGDPRGAERHVERALAIDPRYAPALVARVYNEIYEGRLEQARRHLDELAELGAANAPGVKRARRCVRLEPAEARACIAR